ncbi:MAG: hypothetical protein LC647_15240, partial [Beggiatoa sp.]|nr:hypothetical protein [Beggiatoa sp.]
MRFCRQGGVAKRYPPAVRQDTAADIALLAETDTLHDALPGPATKHLIQRALLAFGDTRTARLAWILWRLSTTFGAPPATGRVVQSRPRCAPPASRPASAESPPPDGRSGCCASRATTKAMRGGGDLYHIMSWTADPSVG